MGLEELVAICWEASFLVPGQQSFFAALYWNWLQLRGSYSLGLVGLKRELLQTKGWVRHVDTSSGCVLGASTSLAQEPPPPGLDYGLFLPVLSQSLPQPLGALPDPVPGEPWAAVPPAPLDQWAVGGEAETKVGRDEGRQVCLWSGLSSYLPAFTRGRLFELWPVMKPRSQLSSYTDGNKAMQLYLLPSAVSYSYCLRLHSFSLSPTPRRSCHGSHAAIHVALQ